NGDDFKDYLGNSMEEAAISLVPEIENIKNKMLEYGADFSLMSGSGSSVFTLSEDEKFIKYLYRKFKRTNYLVRHTRILK
ncbi:MAG: 4-(cytidine 5'-diphospho)-2-C-methyl-D-erythritol kinase, partial [Erysipelotrichaceae bacterium]